jgi:hypothetical protein
MTSRMRRPAIREPSGYGNVKFDRIGITYTTVLAVWTAFFVVGLVILLRNRKLSFIRLKNVPLVVAALVLLHIQLSFDLLAYPLNGVLPCALEFWIMNTCLPYVNSPYLLVVQKLIVNRLGIALFQAQNMQLFSMFWHQTHLLFRSKNKNPMVTEERRLMSRNPLVRWWGWWSSTCYLRRMYIIIAIGTTAQVLIGLIIFLISKKFQPWGVVSRSGTSWMCRSGWEW